jgi:hypothetical protein
VKSTGPDKWAAACPLCQSRNGRPIAIRALSDGRVLMNPFCCCATSDVLQAIGLSLADLFPQHLSEFKPERRPFDAMEVLMAIAHEVTVAVLISHDLAERADDEQRERLILVSQRLNRALALIDLPVPEEIKRIRRSA